jgi:hypothetical protein
MNIPLNFEEQRQIDLISTAEGCAQKCIVNDFVSGDDCLSFDYNPETTECLLGTGKVGRAGGVNTDTYEWRYYERSEDFTEACTSGCPYREAFNYDRGAYRNSGMCFGCSGEFWYSPFLGPTDACAPFGAGWRMCEDGACAPHSCEDATPGVSPLYPPACATSYASPLYPYPDVPPIYPGADAPSDYMGCANGACPVNGSCAHAYNVSLCRPWTICLDVAIRSLWVATEYETASPTPTTDRACTSLTICENDGGPRGDGEQYQTLAPTVTSDRNCTNATVCDEAVEYETVPKTRTADRSCAWLTNCTGAFVTDRGWSACVGTNCVGQWETRPKTPTTDRSCADLTVCIALAPARTACLDEGILSFYPPILVYMENPYRNNTCK